MKQPISRWPRFKDIRKIAALRSNSLGDYIFTLPALCALSHAYPEAEIVLLGKQWHAEFLNNRPGPVDRVLILPFITGVCETPGTREDPAAVDRFTRDAVKEKFDLCVQLYGGGRYSNPFVGTLGGRYAVGMKAADADAAGLDRWVPYIYYYPEVLRYLEVAALAGAAEITRAPRLEVTKRDMEEAGSLLPPGENRLVILHPGATDSRRQWPPEKFVRLARALLEAGCRVCVTGTGNEKDLCAFIQSETRSEVHNLCGALSLGGLAGALAMSSLVVANDTGPLHLARAVGAPTVAIYWIGNYINAGPPDIARHRSHLSWRLACPECGVNCIEASCDHRPSFVADIPAEEVWLSARELLAI